MKILSYTVFYKLLETAPRANKRIPYLAASHSSDAGGRARFRSQRFFLPFLSIEKREINISLFHFFFCEKRNDKYK
jgi:hypothetical protein